MKRVSLSIGATVREADAYEYPIRLEPKGDAVKATVAGVESRVRTTSGRGKSAIPNFYVYFVEGEKLFYAKSTAEEVSRVKTEAVVIANVAPGEVKAVEAPAAVEAPKARRRVAKA